MLPIDDAVDVLTIKSSKHSIRSDYAGDPYQAARTYLAMAAIKATEAVEVERAIRERRGALQFQLERAEALRKEMADFAAAFSPGLAARRLLRGFARPDYEAQNHVFDRMTKARDALLADPMREIVEGLQQGLAGMPAVQASADTFSAAFAEVLGYGWKDLTGNDPDHRPRFRRFVERAYDTLSVTIEGPLSAKLGFASWRLPERKRPINWERQICNMLARVGERPEWDGWGRYERGSLPPGTKFDDRTEEERRAWREKRWAEAYRDEQEYLQEYLKCIGTIPDAEKGDDVKAFEAMLKRRASRNHDRVRQRKPKTES